MDVEQIRNTKPPFEVYEKNGKDWVRSTNGGYDASADATGAALVVGALFLLGMCIVELTKDKKEWK